MLSIGLRGQWQWALSVNPLEALDSYSVWQVVCIQQAVDFGSSGGIRIHTLRILNPLPLPIGVLSHILSQADFLPHSYF